MKLALYGIISFMPTYIYNLYRCGHKKNFVTQKSLNFSPIACMPMMTCFKAVLSKFANVALT